MNEFGPLAKLAADMGGLGVALAVIVFFGYGVRAGVGLAREYAPQFISAHQAQTAAIRELGANIAHSEKQTAEAIGETARTMRDVMEDQRQVLIVMRSISAELRDLGESSNAADVAMRAEIRTLSSAIRGPA